MSNSKYPVNFFKVQGYARNQCRVCKSYFWSIIPKDICEDIPCQNYKFLETSVTDRKFTSNEIRNNFLSFFEQKGHEIVKRYPVVPRWRNDIFLVNASIYNFQPLVTSGTIKPPANPLVISQPCIRFTDIDSIGKTSKYLSTFEMLSHTVFNTKQQYVYWKDETIELCHEYFTKVLHIPQEKIVYKEHMWAGGGNAGIAPEVIIAGLEVATLVFMNLKLDSEGNMVIDNEKYSEMDINVVDTGYGLERITWLTQQTPTIYEAIYPEVLQLITKNISLPENINLILKNYYQNAVYQDFKTNLKTCKEIDEKWILLQAQIYALADHTKTIAFLLTDGIVPSNIKSGYLARLIIRKALRAAENLHLPIDIGELIEMHCKLLKSIYPELYEALPRIMEILDIEKLKYFDTITKGKKIIEQYKTKISSEELVKLYDTFGIHPDFVKKHYPDIDIPEDFHQLLAQKHSNLEIISEVKVHTNLPHTELLYYEKLNDYEFEGKVLWCDNGKVILDKTLFYPEGGGQPCDLGTICGKKVSKVEKISDSVIHYIDENIPVGTYVIGKIDKSRRLALTRQHTATHIILASARKLLGSHIWQAGAQKDLPLSRLDITHYKKLTHEEVRNIEILANKYVLDCLEIKKDFVDHGDAQKKYGFELYQGGAAPLENTIRVVSIGDIDTQACAGTHCNNTNEIGLIKIISTERIQDGIERIWFSTGLEALKLIHHTESIISNAADVFGISSEQLSETCKRFFTEWKQLQKKIDKLEEKLAIAYSEKIFQNAKKIKNINVVCEIVSLELTEIIKLALQIAKYPSTISILATLQNNKAHIVCASSQELNINCAKLIAKISASLGGTGGGKKNFAQGVGNAEKLTSEILWCIVETEIL